MRRSARGVRCKHTAAAPLAIAFAGFSLACGAEPELASPHGSFAAPIVYGSDDREEYFEATVATRSRLAQSAVALVPWRQLERDPWRVTADTPSLGESAGLCAGEPFFEQPAAAFCSGVLVDWDLVLTAGHCLRLLALEDFAVVFGYHQRAPGELEFGAGDVLQPVEIVSEALDPVGREPRLDFGWLRLSEPARPPHKPAPLRIEAQPLSVGEPLVVIGSAGGTPLKVDAAGTITDLHAPVFDYFIANTDTSDGASGAGAFDASLSLVGVLARGGDDFVPTAEGCLATAYADDSSGAEQFTYAARALAGLCDEANDPASICRADCGDPCEALPLTQGGCSFSAPSAKSRTQRLALSVALLMALVTRRRAAVTSGQK
jgi:hypothetical protein